MFHSSQAWESSTLTEQKKGPRGTVLRTCTWTSPWAAVRRALPLCRCSSGSSATSCPGTTRETHNPLQHAALLSWEPQVCGLRLTIFSTYNISTLGCIYQVVSQEASIFPTVRAWSPSLSPHHSHGCPCSAHCREDRLSAPDHVSLYPPPSDSLLL